MPAATGKPEMTRAWAFLVRLMDIYRAQDDQITWWEIQKLAYFIQEAGEPMRLRYVKHRYGPYADNLNQILQQIEGYYIRGYVDRNYQAAICPIPEGVESASAFLDSSPEAIELLKRICRLITGFETPYGLDLLATVHWIIKTEPSVVTETEVVIRNVQEWRQRKRELFKPEHIQKAWQRLKDEWWLPDPSAV